MTDRTQPPRHDGDHEDLEEIATASKEDGAGKSAIHGDRAGPSSADAGRTIAPQKGEPQGHSH